MRGVHKHDPAEIGSRISGEDFSFEAVPAQHRNDAGVVNVRVADQQRIHAAGQEGELGIVIDGLVAPALEHAAFEEQPLTVDFEQMLGAGRGLVGAVEK